MVDQGLDLHVLNAAKTHASTKGKCTWADVREAEGTVAFNGCVELNVTMMLKVFTYHGPNPRNSEHIAGLALRASFRFNSSHRHGPFARSDSRLSDQIWGYPINVGTGGHGTSCRGGEGGAIL
jgi:hypothetical protein